MKAVLRVVVLLALLSTTTLQSRAQCSVSDLLIQNITPVGIQTPGTCTATFDLSFTLEANNGNKFVFIHVFADSLYADYFECDSNGQPGSNGAIQPPEASDLVNTFINLGIDNSTTASLLTTYQPDPSVTFNSADSVTRTILPDGSQAFVIHNVTATFPADCGMPLLLRADVWSTQAASANVAQCVNCNLAFAINFMSAAGLANCANLTYSAVLTNRIGSPMSGYYQVYADANFDFVLSLSSDSLIRDTTAFSLAPGVGSTFPITGSIPPVNINQNLFLVVTQTSGVGDGSVTILQIQSTQCIALPVVFGYFTAERINSGSVLLRWQTLTEINNNGFAIERNMGDAVWVTVGFVPTQGSNSTVPLNYTFTDANNSRTVTQYRLRQVDNDNRVKYSEIRIVRGFDQTGDVLVYPNPSTSGLVNILFNNGEINRDVIITDMNGRIVNQWNNMTNTLLQVNNLPAGTYILRVKNRADGKQTVAKFVILGRE